MGVASKKQILTIIGISALIIVLLVMWIEYTNGPSEEVLLDETEELEGPLSAEELERHNPEITNDMNRIAVINTTEGTIEVELFEELMPVTTGNFIKLAEEGFYDGTKFHRVIDNFMIQGGDPNTKEDDATTYGQGGPGYTIKDEFVEDAKLTNTRGTLAMANTGQPDSGGSQFFINLVDNTGLDFNKEPSTSKHPVFGQVINGLDVVDAISDVETVPGRDLPVEPIVIESIEIREQ